MCLESFEYSEEKISGLCIKTISKGIFRDKIFLRQGKDCEISISISKFKEFKNTIKIMLIQSFFNFKIYQYKKKILFRFQIYKKW